jgi:DNA-binding NtrC family response regulator
MLPIPDEGRRSGDARRSPAFIGRHFRLATSPPRVRTVPSAVQIDLSESKMNPTILLVEDDHAVRNVLADMLHHAGYRVTGVGRFDEAERALASAAYDLLISDVCLPGGWGTDLAAQAIAKERKAILITGYADLQQMLEVKKFRYLKKPFRVAQLLAAVEESVGPAMPA